MRDWLKSLRKEKGLSIKEVSGKLGISESYYSLIEDGSRQKNMDITLASGLASIFQIPISEVVAKESSHKQ